MPSEIIDDPDFYFGEGNFELPNGDVYSGGYGAHRIGIIWREGHGTYTTKDGQIYTGYWKDDKLKEKQPLEIKYPSGVTYCGNTAQCKYVGPGIYTLDNKMDINCEFIDNRPVGNIVLIDSNGRLWQGLAGISRAVLLPENIFFNSLLDTTGVGKAKTKYQRKVSEAESVDRISKESQLPYRELEKLVFGKSQKTEHDIDFTDSKWFKRYLRYSTMLESILKKVKASESVKEEESYGEGEEEWGDEEYITESEEEGEKEQYRLNAEEIKWYKKYIRHKRAQKQKLRENKQIKPSELDISLLDMFYSKEYQDRNPAIKIFRPENTPTSTSINIEER